MKSAVRATFPWLVLFASSPLVYGDSWLGGSGYWFDPNNLANGCTNWSICPSPSTGNIFITAPNSAVLENADTALTSLTIAAGNSVTAINTSHFDFEGSGAATLKNSGNIYLANAAGMAITGSPSPDTLTLTATGGGTITLKTANNRIGGDAGSLINQETIQGQGSIITGGTVTNHGTINANINGGTFEIEPSNAGLTNTGTLKATNGGTLDLVSGFSSVVLNNAGGIIEAFNGSTVLNQFGIISGGTLTTSGTGVIQNASFGGTLENLTNAGLYQIVPSSSIALQGTINNTGVIQEQGTLAINGNVTLQGTGVVKMSNTINGYGAGNLTNLQTIEGSGTLYDLGLVNGASGTIISNQPSGLVILPDNDGFKNVGTLQVNSGSTLTIEGQPNDFLNYNSSTSTLTGGTYLVAGALQLGETYGMIAINAANILLNGPASQITNGSSVNALATLASNSGSFTIENGRNFTTAGDFTNQGFLDVGNGSTFTVGPSGANTYNQNAGTTQIERGGTLTAANFNFNGGNLVVNGTLDPLSLHVCATCTLGGNGSIAANVTSDGTIAPGSLSTHTPGTLTIDGNFNETSGVFDELIGASGNGLLKVSGSVSLNSVTSLDILLSGFTPTDGETFDILNYGAASGLTGAFGDASVSGFTKDGWNWKINYSYQGDEILLTAVSPTGGTTSITPEPRTLLLFGIGLLVIARLKRNHRK